MVSKTTTTNCRLRVRLWSLISNYNRPTRMDWLSGRSMQCRNVPTGGIVFFEPLVYFLVLLADLLSSRREKPRFVPFHEGRVNVDPKIDRGEAESVAE